MNALQEQLSGIGAFDIDKGPTGHGGHDIPGQGIAYPKQGRSRQGRVSGADRRINACRQGNQEDFGPAGLKPEEIMPTGS